MILFLYIYFFLTSQKLTVQPKGCQEFKTGLFSYVKKENQHWVVTRDEGYQTESSDSLNVAFKAKIEWLSDCSYRLEYVEASSGQEFVIGRKIEAEIISISKNQFEVKSTFLEGSATYVFKKIGE